MRQNTFRLFISSTFSDFKQEREALQKDVFPDVRNFCRMKGFNFQPIDLRWGVTHKAQLDHKTLELCLNEVKTCKSYPHPNFLIMIGDRYGWIPLPYSIEKHEFDTLLRYMSYEQKVFVTDWYLEDLNQIPISYILKERKDKFEEQKEWELVEEKLRKYLQEAAIQSNIATNKKNKYFTSATEAEVKERIFGDSLSVNQSSDRNKYESIDKQHIFGFIRDSKKEDILRAQYFSNDFKQAQLFKDRVKNHLRSENTLHITTEQTISSKINSSYLNIFIEQTKQFLITKIKEHISSADKLKLNPLAVELEGQKLHLQQKLKNFYGQENLRNVICEHITGNSNKPLLIYGNSGMGKSSLIAKAIQEAQEKSKFRVLYRFIGATNKSNTTKEILLSIFSELGIAYNNKSLDRKKESILPFDKQESYEEFCLKINNEIQNIKDNVIIFIDAVDQLINNDLFTWLPSDLPQNVKFVISALHDDKYPEDSQYYYRLKLKTNLTFKVLANESPLTILRGVLNSYNRILQPVQEEYFLKQYRGSESPLYIIVAAEELRHWRSYDLVETQEKNTHKLSSNQEEIILDFINNLNELYHHKLVLVNKVLGYMVASKDGLSESELLNLLSIDSSFINELAPEIWYKNITQELPLIFWTRLHTMLSPFIGIKLQDGEELLYFTHREFKNVIKQRDSYREECFKILRSTQDLIAKHQRHDFNSNRFGKLHLLLLTNLTDEEIELNVDFLLNINEKWKSDYLDHCIRTGTDYNDNFKFEEASSRLNHSSNILKKAYEKFDKWKQQYAFSLANLSNTYSGLKYYDEALELSIESNRILKDLYLQDPDKWSPTYLISLTNLADSYYSVFQPKKALASSTKAMQIIEPLYSRDKTKWINEYITAYNRIGLSHLHLEEYLLAIKTFETIDHILRSYYTSDSLRHNHLLSTNLINIGVSYRRQGLFDKSIEYLEKAYKFRKEEFEKNSDLVSARNYLKSISELRLAHTKLNDNANITRLSIEAINLLKRIIGGKSLSRGFWTNHYVSELVYIASNNIYQSKTHTYWNEVFDIIHVNYLIDSTFWDAILYSTIKKYNKKFLVTSEVSKQYFLDKIGDIELKHRSNPLEWSNMLCMYLNAYANHLVISSNNYNEPILISRRIVTIIESNYSSNPKSWIKNLSRALFTLHFCYSKLKDWNNSLMYAEMAKEKIEPLYNKFGFAFHHDYFISLNYVAKSHYYLGKVKKAIYLQEKVINKIDESGNKEVNIVFYIRSLRNLANYYSKLANYEQAIFQLEKAIRYIEQKLLISDELWANRLRNILLDIIKYCQLYGNKVKQYDKLQSLSSVSKYQYLNTRKNIWGMRYAEDLEKLALESKDRGIKNWEEDYFEAKRIRRRINTKN